LKKLSCNKRVCAIIALVLIVAIFFSGYGIKTNIKTTLKGGQFGSSELKPVLTTEFSKNKTAPKGYLKAAQNNGLVLFVNPKTAEFSVYNISEKEYWYSNPIDSQNDTVATGDIKNNLKSQLIVEYYDSTDKIKSMNTAFYSVAQESFEIKPIENGFRAEYTIGKPTYELENLPRVVEADKFQKLVIDELEDEKEIELITRRYKKICIDELESIRKDTYLEVYPDIDTDKYYYILNPSTPDYEYEDIYNAIFKHSSYTDEDLEKDNKESSLEAAQNQPELIFVPLEITLDKGCVKASIPCEEMYIPQGIYIKQIQLLPYFGAAGINDNGYIFVPDGSGAIINLNNGKIKSPSFSVPIYGRDAAITQQNIAEESRALLAVFGEKKGKTGFWAAITEGESHASVNALISGVNSSYNNVYASFEILPVDFMKVKSGSDIITTNKYQNGYYKGRVTVEYHFTDKNRSDYDDFAVDYREYLTEKGILKAADKTHPVFLLELLGSVKAEKNTLGINYNSRVSLTDFNQAGEIVSLLGDYGVTETVVEYSAWYKASSSGNAGTSADFNRKLGSKSDFNAFKELVESFGGNVYLNTSSLEQHTGLSAFNRLIYGTRRTYNEIMSITPSHIATGIEDEDASSYYLLSPRCYSDYLNRLFKRISAIGADSLWIPDGGNLLYSDFSQSNTIDREISKDALVAAMSKKNGMAVGADSPNQYALSFTDIASDIPFESSGHILTDADVPFVSIVLSGCMQATGEIVNLSGNAAASVLKAAETGSGLYYKWIYEDNTLLCTLDGDEPKKLYSLNYSSWVKEAAEAYVKLREKTARFDGKSIIGHKQLAEDVYLTTYENGSVIVNYSDKVYKNGQMTVNPMDYSVYVKGE